MKRRHRGVGWAVCVLLLLVANAHAYYSAEQGRWVSRDPIEEDGGANLYVYALNSPLQGLDHLGLDCISVADRPVDNTMGIFRHYALEKWQGCCPEKGRQVATASWGRGVAKDKVELLNTGGATAEGLVTSGPDQGRWIRFSVRISVINYGLTSGASDTQMKCLFDDSDGSVDDKWRSILALAANYEYAEQGGRDDGKTPIARVEFIKFPKSIYRATKNNSNVFIRFMASQAGLEWSEMRGWHPPGFTSPVDDPEYRYWRNPRHY
jgi:hypothetical protein